MRLFPVALVSLLLLFPAASGYGGPYEDGIAAQNRGDNATAVALYRKAAEQGHLSAMTSLGFMYERGLGVRADPGEAAYWYRRAAEAGEPMAMFDIGILYRDGRGVPQNQVRAVQWFQKAADAGVVDAHYSLAQAYEAGNGVTRDFRAAAEHMFKSLQGGYDFAVQEMTTNADAWNIAFRRELQRIMKEAGIYTGAIDGQFGPQTKHAIMSVADYTAARKETLRKPDANAVESPPRPTPGPGPAASPLDQLPDIEGLEKLQ